MAQETLVTEAFTDRLRVSGESTLRACDDAGLDIRAALWLYLPDAGRWRLVLGTPYVRIDGPRKVYRKVQSAVAKVDDAQRATVDLQSITVVDIHDPLIVLLRSAIRTGPGIGGVRFSGNMINGVLINDAYIYRLV